MRLRIALAALLAVAFFGCPFKEGSVAREQPVRSTLYSITKAMDAFTADAYIPRCVTADSPDGWCRTWREKVDPSIVAAHARAFSARQRVEEGREVDRTTRQSIAGGLREAAAAADDIRTIDRNESRSAVYASLAKMLREVEERFDTEGANEGA